MNATRLAVRCTILAVFSLGVASCLVTAPPPGAQVGGSLNTAHTGVSMQNDLGQRVCYAQFVRAGEEGWGGDWLGPTEVIEPNQSRAFPVDSQQRWNVRFLDCNRSVIMERSSVAFDTQSVRMSQIGANPQPALRRSLVGASRAPTQAVAVPRTATQRGQGTDAWDEGIRELAQGLAATLEMPPDRRLRLAVLDFTQLDGSAAVSGARVAQGLIVQLFQTRRFEIVERRSLSSVLSELRLSLSDLTDPTTAARVGRVLGAEAVATGTVDFAGQVTRLNGRIIRVETGAIAAVAQASIRGDAQGGSAATAEPGGGGQSGQSPQARTVLHEDFQSVPVGAAPSSWLGTEHYAVQEDSRGRRAFACFDSGPARFTIPVGAVSGNYRIEVVFSWIIVPGFMVTGLLFGGVRAGVDLAGGVYLNGATATVSPQPQANSPVTFVIEKTGDVYRVFVDGREALLGRYPGLQPSNVLVLEMVGRGAVSCGGVSASTTLHRVSIENL